MTKKQTKKQPINVQLSKDDLKELLTVLKNFLVEELLNFHKRDAERILNLEIAQAYLKSEIRGLKTLPIPNQILHCAHEYKFSRAVYSSSTDACYGIVYICKWCKRERTVYKSSLSWREKRGLRKLGVEA